MMLSVNQVGEQLAISPSLVRREIEEGRLPFHVFGKGAIRISTEDLEAYITSRRKLGSKTQLPSLPHGVANTKRRKEGFRHIRINQEPSR
jgi:excisionase family DNA binding protein